MDKYLEIELSKIVAKADKKYCLSLIDDILPKYKKYREERKKINPRF